MISRQPLHGADGGKPLPPGFLGRRARPEDKRDPLYIAQVVQQFQRQSQSDNCEPTCFKNLLDELAARNGVRQLRHGLKELNDMFDYRRGFFCDSNLGISKLSDALKPVGFRVRKTYGDPTNVDLLRRAIESVVTSFPIIAVHPDYFGEQILGYKTVGDPHVDHALIVLAMDAVDVTFFDPYENYLKAKAVTKVRTHLPLLRVNEHWRNADRPYWIAWIEPVAKQLEYYGATT